MYLLALYLGRLRGAISDERYSSIVADLMAIPSKIEEVLASESSVHECARKYHQCDDFLFLGRSVGYPVAMEGALKLKEISYIHAEGYPAGEMKHGPIALIDKDMPTVALAPQDPWYEKMVSQIEQAKARGGKVVVVATQGDKRVPNMADYVLWVPEIHWMLSPVVTVIPLQLLAYHIASLRGLDVDQPRNLAKSVTVE